MAEADAWYFVVKRPDREGPVSLESLRALYAAGTVTDATLVWKPGMAQWQRYGTVFGTVDGSMPPPIPPVGTSTGFGPAAAAASSGRYAGFWLRVGASMIDSFVVGAAAIVIVIGVALSGTTETTAIAIMQLASWVGGWLYYALMHSSELQATLGKQALGIKVTGLDGQRIGFGRATGRYFASILSGITLGIGYVMAGFTQRRQALHDMVAGTYVVTKDAGPDAIVAGLGAPKVSGGVVALAVCASMVPVLGILAAIAIPAYQDYLIRAQVSEGLTAAARFKAAVAESYAQGKDFADISTESLRLETLSTGKYVDTIEVVGGVVVITYGKQANTHLRGQQIGLLPGTNEQDELVWTCGLAAVPDGVEPAVDDGEQYTNVPPKYLPSLCRGT